VEAQSFQGLGNFSTDSSTRNTAEDLSADGRVVVGQSNGRAFRWTLESGLQSLGFLEDGTPLGRAFATSGDGSIVVGSNYFAEQDAFRWTAEAGATSLVSYGTGYGMTRDGRVVVGAGVIGYRDEAFRWSEETGLRVLPSLGFGAWNAAYSISDNGRVIAGQSGSGGGQAVIWVDGGQPRLLGELSGHTRSYGSDVSSGGDFVVGTSQSRDGQSDEAFIWSEGTGMLGLGDLPGGAVRSGALAVTADGQTVVGGSSDRTLGGSTERDFSAFLWTAGLGMRPLKTELESHGVDLTGWHLTFATGITDDGRTIVGRGVNPRGFEEGWIATIPEPSTVGLLSTALGGLLFGFRAQRRKATASALVRRRFYALRTPTRTGCSPAAGEGFPAPELHLRAAQVVGSNALPGRGALWVGIRSLFRRQGVDPVCAP